MSSALPAGGPSKMSVSTTSARSRSTIRWAVVDPTNPLPTTVTFCLLMPLLVSNKILLCKSFTPSTSLREDFISPSRLAGRRHTLHVLNNRRCKRRGAHLRRARHQALEIVSHALLLNRPRDAILDQPRRFLAPQKLKHHRPREHHRAGIDYIFVRIFRRRAMSGLKYAKPIADIRTRRHAQAADLGRARVGQIISIEIGSRQHTVFVRTQQHLLKN